MTLTLPFRRTAAGHALALFAALTLAAGVSLAGAPPPGPPDTADGPAAVTPPVARLAATDPGREIRVIVQLTPGADPAAVRAAVRSAGGRAIRDIALIGGLSAEMTAAAAEALGTQPGVRAVSVDAPIVETGLPDPGALATAYNQSIRSDYAWSRGFTGRGVTVAIIDTGIRGDLPDFRASDGDRRSRVVADAVVNPAASDGDDTFGHGTHVAGLIAGNAAVRDAGDPLRGRYAGAAPEASLVAVKADDGEGGATVLDVIDGLQFVVDHRAALNIRVVNLSLSSTVAESHLTDPLDAAVEATWKSGVVVVVAAGNRGGSGEAVHYAPANDPWVITVGGVDDRGTKEVGDDRLASWSSRGTTQDGTVKPDVVAPAARLVSTIPPGSRYAELCPTCVVDGAYFRVGGTSMAAAVASGAIATLLQAHPGWTPDQVKYALVRRSRAVENAELTDGVVVDAQGRPQPAGTTPTSEVSGAEIALDKVLRAYESAIPPSANQGLALNSLLDPATGQIDYTRTSWTRTSWTEAVEPLRTSWTRTSWTRTSWTRTSWTATEQSCTDFERTSWTRTSWTSEDVAWARSQCDALLASIEPSRTSWTRTSWTRTSWTTSFDK